MLVVSGIVIWVVAGSGGATKKSSVVVFARVQRRTLQDTVSLSGTLARKQLRNITAGTQGLVSAVYSKNATFARAGASLFAINGRRAIAEQGTVSFFRILVPGDQGDDVTQLKRILTAAGDYPGPLDNQFTQQTQFALAQWQAQHHYPNSTPANPEAVTVALQQGAGYRLGSQTSAGLIIGPPPAQAASYRVAAPRAALADLVVPYIPTPSLTIQSVNADVPQGSSATFVIQASVAAPSDLTVNLSSGGTAGSADVVSPPASVVLPAGSTSTSVSVQTLANNLVKAEPTLVVSLAAGSGYSVGSPDSAQTTITNNNVPTLQITGTTAVSPGGTATLTVTADQAPLHNIQVPLALSGSATPGTDYNPVNPVLTLNAGSTSASVTVNTVKVSAIEPSKYLVVSISPSPSSYSIGAQGSAVVTINGSGALPAASLTSATSYLQKGQPYVVTVSLSQATSSPVTVALSYGGTAVAGTDYNPPGGVLVVPAGQTALQVSIPTVTDDVVESNRVLTVALAPAAGYQIGSPSSTSVTITSSVLPTLTISSNTSTVTQGGAASFTISADQAPVKDTSVNFSAQGTAQPGQNYVPLVGTALLKAGQTRVTVVLQSIQNNVTFDPTDMIVGQWPTRIGQVFVKAGAPVTPGEPDPLAHRADAERHPPGVGGEPEQAAGRSARHGPDQRGEQRRRRGRSPSSTPARRSSAPGAPVSPSRSTRGGSR